MLIENYVLRHISQFCGVFYLAVWWKFSNFVPQISQNVMKKLFTLFALPMLLAAACFTSCEPGNNPSTPAGVQMVDLGLSVKWAKMNVGAFWKSSCSRKSKTK